MCIAVYDRVCWRYAADNAGEQQLVVFDGVNEHQNPGFLEKVINSVGQLLERVYRSMNSELNSKRQKDKKESGENT